MKSPNEDRWMYAYCLYILYGKLIHTAICKCKVSQVFKRNLNRRMTDKQKALLLPTMYQNAFLKHVKAELFM